MLNVKVDPWPSLDLTEMDPPMNSDIFLHMVILDPLLTN